MLICCDDPTHIGDVVGVRHGATCVDWCLACGRPFTAPVPLDVIRRAVRTCFGDRVNDRGSYNTLKGHEQPTIDADPPGQTPRRDGTD
jgi:hypothetical protein